MSSTSKKCPKHPFAPLTSTCVNCEGERLAERDRSAPRGWAKRRGKGFDGDEGALELVAEPSAPVATPAMANSVDPGYWSN